MNNLYTKRGETLNGEYKTQYPRPQLKRDSFFSLDGTWQLEVENQNYNILVPFCPESLLSGIGKYFGETLLCYKKQFTLPQGFVKDRVLLHFGAVDQVCTLLLNGREVGYHVGGYDPFWFDITDYLQPVNELTLLVTDSLNNHILPYGKQREKRGGMWYTPVSGIWQSVWLESVPETYIKSLKIDVTLNTALIAFDGIETGTVTVEGATFPIENGVAEITIETPKNWTPETPYLYEFTATAGEDTISSYFALRTLAIKGNQLLLNGNPYFFNGVLDQGYFSDGIYTPAHPSEYEDDILKMKSLGFNMLRKHIKVEPEAFYYYCDKHGMAVFQDMVNNGRYFFVRDTVLPTLRLTRKWDKFAHPNPASRQAFVEGMKKTVMGLYNHPCIVEWTIFNEGWGQFCANEMYHTLKEWDSSRFIDSASGWFTAKENDFTSLHIYFRKLKAKESKKPLFLSEFGGYSHKIKNHAFNPHKTYGYGKYETREEFVKAFRDLYQKELLPLKEKGLCACVYTQLSDVEDETNGLITYDRKEMKLHPNETLDLWK